MLQMFRPDYRTKVPATRRRIGWARSLPGRSAFIVIVCASLLAILSALHSVRAGAQATAQSGGLSGFAFVGADNTVILSRSPNPPPGAHAASGATATVGSISTIVDGSGAFTLQNIHAGLGTLQITTSQGPAGTFPVTIFGGVTAKLGAPAVTRAAALALVMGSLSPSKPDPERTVIIGPQEPLPVGTTVSPAYGDENGQANEALNHAVRSEQWLVYVDPNLLLRYSKPVQFFFVDAASGAITKLDEMSWPLINGLSYYGNRDTILQSPDLMAGPKALPRIAARAPVSQMEVAVVRNTSYPGTTRTIEGTGGHDGARLLLASLLAHPATPRSQAAPTAGGTGTTFGLVVEGADESDQNADISNITQMFGQGGIPSATSTKYSKPGDSVPKNKQGQPQRRADMLAKFQAQCSAAGPNDTLFIYITAHGIRPGKDGVQLERAGTNKDGEPFDYESLDSSQFDFSKCKACYIVIIIDSCYSGAMASGFDKALKKTPCPPNYTIVSATDSNTGSLGIPYYGGYFTNKFLSAFSDQATANPNGADLSKAFQGAKGTAINMLYQNPQLYVRSGCPCNKPSTTPCTTGQGGSTTGQTGITGQPTGNNSSTTGSTTCQPTSPTNPPPTQTTGGGGATTTPQTTPGTTGGAPQPGTNQPGTGGATPQTPKTLVVPQPASETPPCPTQEDCDRLKAAADQAEEDAAAAKAAVTQAEGDQQKAIADAYRLDAEAEREAMLPSELNPRTSDKLAAAAAKHKQAQTLRDNAAAALKKAQDDAVAKTKAAEDAKKASDNCFAALKNCPPKKTATATNIPAPLPSFPGGSVRHAEQEDSKSHAILVSNAQLDGAGKVRVDTLDIYLPDGRRATITQVFDEYGNQVAGFGSSPAEILNAIEKQVEQATAAQTSHPTGAPAPANAQDQANAQAAQDAMNAAARENGFGKVTPILPPGYEATLNPDGSYTYFTPQGTFRVTLGADGKPVFDKVNNSIGAGPAPTGNNTTSLNPTPSGDSIAFGNFLGRPEAIVGAGVGGPPYVRAFDLNTGKPLQSFLAYDPTFTGGVYVAAGDVNGDGKADIITGAGPGGGPQVKVFDGSTGQLLNSFLAYDPTFMGGVHVAVGDVNGDGKNEIVTEANTGGGFQFKLFNGAGVNVAFAPTSQNPTAIPRFADSTPCTFVPISVCRTALLFPFLTNQAGFDTGLAINKTSTDPFGALPGGNNAAATNPLSTTQPVGATLSADGLTLTFSPNYSLTTTSPGTFVPSLPGGGNNPQPAMPDYGATLGGPIVKDHLWFWGSYGKTDIRLQQPPNVTNTALNGLFVPTIQYVAASGAPSDNALTGPGVTRITPRKPESRRSATARWSSTRIEVISLRSRDPFLANSPLGLMFSRTGETSQEKAPGEIIYSIVANGNSSGQALELQIFDPSGTVTKAEVPEGVVLEPVKVGSAKSVSDTSRGGNVLTKALTAYCVEYMKLPPEPGMLYRVAPQAIQDRFSGIQQVLQAGRELAAAGKFHPDSDPQAYLDSIRQYSLWAKIENWDQQKFGEVFSEKTQENAVAAKVKWTKQMAQAVSGLVPGRWRDISMVLDEASKISRAAHGATQTQGAPQ